MRNVRATALGFVAFGLVIALTLAGGATALWAGRTGLEFTSAWRQSTVDDFRAGQAVNVVLSQKGDGELRLGPDETLATRVYPAYHLLGLYTSPPLRAEQGFNRLQLTAGAQVPPGSALEAEVRVSPDGQTWSLWEPVSLNGEALGLESTALYAQYRLTLLADSPDLTPVVNDVTLEYGYTTTTPPSRLIGPTTAAGATYRLYATREGLVGGTTANGHVITERDHFVALPSRRGLATKGGYEYQVRLSYNGRSVTEPVWDVGPWNIHDNYWDDSRDLYSYLPPGLPLLAKGLPESQAAKQTGYNGGKDEFGRTVLNLAGIDLADGTFWDNLGLVGNDWVDVTFLWQPSNPTPTPTPTPRPTPTPKASRPDAVSYYGISTVGTTLYLPVVLRDAYGGWTTGVGLQNAGSSPATIAVTYYAADGQAVLTTNVTVPGRGYWGLYQGGEPLPLGFAGTAVVTSNQPIAAVVNEIATTGQAMSYEGTAQPANTVYLPLIMKNAYGGWTTGLTVQNTSDNPASVTVVYYNDDGTEAGRQTQDVPGRGYWAVYHGSDLLPPGFAGAAIVSSNQPVVTVVNEVSSAGAMSYRGLSTPSAAAYFPVLMNDAYGGWTTGLNVQNTTASPASVTLTYYDGSGGVVTSKSTTIPPLGLWAIFQGGADLPSGYAGSGVLTSSQPVVAVVNEISANGSMSYAGENQGANRVYLPVMLNDAYGGWTTGAGILSLGSGSATITYFDASGNIVGNESKTLSPNSYWALYQGGAGLSPGYAGSAIVSSTSPLVVVVNETPR
ncbi:MAG: hypothetical protein M1358_02225 [Chloroflexi bacterium]|nr:hypothetical protein [Chloroflexota bacterium]